MLGRLKVDKALKIYVETSKQLIDEKNIWCSSQPQEKADRTEINHTGAVIQNTEGETTHPFPVPFRHFWNNPMPFLEMDQWKNLHKNT